MNSNYSITRAHDSDNLAKTDGYTGQLQLNWNTEIAAQDNKKLPLQAFVRYAVQSNQNIDNTFGLRVSTRSWTVNTGINLSF